MKKLALWAACVFAVPQAGALASDYVNPVAYPQTGDPSSIEAVIEIPAGGFTKYEIDTKTGHLFVDRFQSMSVVYPANYGSIPSTLGGDSDPLDVLVLAREPIYPGALIRVRPIGVLRMIDGGESDDKIISVPVSKVDPTYDDIKTIDDLPSIERDRIAEFFTVYKKIPAGSKVVEVKGYDGVNAAVDEIKSALDAFKSQTH